VKKKKIQCQKSLWKNSCKRRRGRRKSKETGQKELQNRYFCSEEDPKGTIVKTLQEKKEEEDPRKKEDPNETVVKTLQAKKEEEEAPRKKEDPKRLL
jgi:hypothetical protein